MYQATVQPAPADTDAEINRNAYNAAFDELGLMWVWDNDTHHRLLAIADERERLRLYIETQQAHLLKAYEADFLINAIHSVKQRRYASRCI